MQWTEGKVNEENATKGTEKIKSREENAEGIERESTDTNEKKKRENKNTRLPVFRHPRPLDSCRRVYPSITVQWLD